MDPYSYSKVLAMTRYFVGPLGRVWRRGEEVHIGLEDKGDKVVYGIGPDLRSAFHDAFGEAISKFFVDRASTLPEGSEVSVDSKLVPVEET